LLEEFVTALAANRLGVRAPMHAFEGRRDAVIRFVDEGLCQVQRAPEVDEAVLWFHSALASAIYEELFPGGAFETRAIHLDRFFATIIDDRETSRNFLEFLGKTKNQRLPEELAREALRKIGYRLIDREPPNLRISSLSAWQVAGVARSLPVKHILNADRLRVWMSSPALDARGWGLLFQLLWERLPPEQRELFAIRAMEWLSSHQDLQEWSFVWRLLWKGEPFKAELTELARSWLDDHAMTRGWSFVFHDLFDASITAPWLKNAAIRGLTETPFTSADRYLWVKARALGVADAEFLPLLVHRLCRSQIANLTRAGVRLIAELVPSVGSAGALVALEEGQEEMGWPHVFQEIISVDVLSSEELLPIGRAWLLGREDRPEWAHVWQRLLELAPSDTGLGGLGRAWLTGREDRPEWAHVWQRLLELAPSDTGLRGLGRAWLTGREDRPEWAHVWQRLWRITPTDRGLKEQGERWISEHPHHPGVPHVRRAMFRPS
jgi:hypothetical protein